MRHRVGNDRAHADQTFSTGQAQAPAPVPRARPAASGGEGRQQRGCRDDYGQDKRAAEQRDIADHGQGGRVTRDQVVQPVSRAVIDGLERLPPQPDEDEQDRENDRCTGQQR
jgi:hypothetical protein